MAVAYRSSTTYDTGAGTTSSIVINAPSGLAVSDFIIIGITTSGTVTVTPPTGFTVRQASINLGASGAFFTAYSKPATASEPSTYTFTLSGTAQASATMAAYTGVDLFSPTAGSLALASSGTTSTTIGPSTTTDMPYEIYFVSSYNTTAVRTVSSITTSPTKRTDVSTSASTFIHTSLWDGPPAATRLDSPGANSATFSGTTTGNVLFNGYLRANASNATVPYLTYFISNGIGNGVTSTVQGFAVPEPCHLYISVFIKDTTNTVTSMTSPGLVLTKLGASRGAGTPGVEVWQAYITQPATYTITINYSGSVVVNLLGMGFIGAMVGTVSSSSGTGTTQTGSVTTSANNAFVLSSLIKDTSTASSVSGSMTLLNAGLQAGSTSIFQSSKTTSLVASSGTMTTHTYTSTSANWAMLTYELIPYINKSSFFPFF